MKKLAITAVLCLCTALFFGCGNDRKSSGSSSESMKKSSSDEYDCDLTKMSSTMVYSMVFQMVTEPKKFVGKTIKMKGAFSSYQDEETGRRFFGCVIKDALACCSQGLAFELAKPRKYPDEYPAEGAAIVVEGDYDYEKDEGGGGFPIIRNAELLKQ